MKDMMISKEHQEYWHHHKMDKLCSKRNVAFRAFVINYAAIVVVWLFSLMPWYNNLVQRFMHMDAKEAHFFILDILSIWQVLNVVLFLAPALALWWEMHALRKKREMK
ncbi:MAG: hypothetical protein FWD33_02020 [Alphaproteobacteria bacterium]|nr:hypothetical protein [Alphaproteobacteria bacterium]